MTYDELLESLKDVPFLDARNWMRDAEEHFQKLINAEHSRKRLAIYKEVFKETIVEDGKIVGAKCESNGRKFVVTTVGKSAIFGESRYGYNVVETAEDGTQIEIPCDYNMIKFFEVVLAISNFTNYQRNRNERF